MTKRVLGIGALFLLLAACSSTTNTASPGSSSGATGAQVDRCKQSCDKMKFFDCSSAAEQARCYDDCGKATSSQIEVFTGCAENSICDPECRTTIQPKPAEGTTTTGGGGATASTCTTACAKLVECSFIKVGDKAACEASCQKDAYQYQIDCVNKQSCSTMEKTCGGVSGGGGTTTTGGGEAGEISACQSGCDQAAFFECYTAAQQSTCRNLCTTKPATQRNNYTACERSAGGDCARDTACLTELQK
jgi:hypothetical protein